MQDNLEVVAAPLFFALLVGSGLVWATVIRRLFRRQPLVELEPFQQVDILRPQSAHFTELCLQFADLLLRPGLGFEQPV